jgi:glycosyltransferase involved in cell wall biosynthesis
MKKPLGGSELMYYTMANLVEPGWEKDINLILSFCDWKFIDPTKKNIVWQQLNTNEESTNGMADPKFIETVDYFVWVSYWVYEKFRQKYNVPAYKSIVIRNAAPRAEFKERDRSGKIKLIYTSTPWRGLDILIDAFKLLNRDDVELDVFSSTTIYGPNFEKSVEGQFDWLWDLCKTTPGINYHGYQPNEIVREYVANAHIFSYPNTFEETSCIAAIEALTAGCQIITTGYGALPETCGDWATYIPYGPNRKFMAERFAYELNNAIDNYWSDETQLKIKQQSEYYNKYHTWPIRIQQWQDFFNKVRK